MSTTVRDALWRITFEGTLAGGEIFNHGWWATHDTADTEVDVETTWNAAMNNFLAQSATGAGFTTVQQMFPSTCTWLRVTVRKYNATTHLPITDPFTSELVTPIAGSGGQTLPYQDAYVITLWDGTTIGRARYNRFYLPPFVTSVLSTDGMIGTATRDAILNAFVAVDAAASASSPAGEVNVYHRKAGTVSGANFVRGDTIIDTQRRRRNQLVSVPASVAL